MLQIEIKSKTDESLRYRTVPQEDDCSQLISESCEIFLEGKKILTYLQHFPMDTLRAAVLSIDRIYSNRRQSGVASQSRTFGFMPRMPVQQRDYCTASTLHREYPEAKGTLFYYSNLFSELLREHYPDQYAHSQKAIATVKPDWVLPGGCFTSGVINQDNPLEYHYDAGNFEGTWSVMAVLKQGVAGGHLLLPDYNLKLACQDSSIVIFDGQSEMHGVSPIRKMTEEAYRYSVVFYSLENLCKCGTPKEELRRAQISRTAVEMKRAGLKE